MQDKMLPFPADLQRWCQNAANSNPAGVLAFCCQWAQTLNHVRHSTGGHCRPFESSLNSPASIEAVCDLLEEVIKLCPSLVQDSKNICRLSLIFNRNAAKVYKEKLKPEVMSGPVSVQSALDVTDSDDGL